MGSEKGQATFRGAPRPNLAKMRGSELTNACKVACLLFLSNWFGEFLRSRMSRGARWIMRERWGGTLVPATFPVGSITDARTFIARDIPAVAILSASSGGWPRRLHSYHDSRDRLSLAALDRTVDLLAALVAAVEAKPGMIE